MTLDEAILHAEEVADRCAVTDGNIQCENEHRQLAEWLKDYKRLLNKEQDTKDESFTPWMGITTTSGTIV